MRDALFWLLFCVVMTGCASLSREPDWVMAVSRNFW